MIKKIKIHGFEMAASHVHDCMVTVINVVSLALPAKSSGGISHAFVSNRIVLSSYQEKKTFSKLYLISGNIPVPYMLFDLISLTVIVSDTKNTIILDSVHVLLSSGENRKGKCVLFPLEH